MIVSQFQAWARTASPPSRADGVSALARALLYSDLTADQGRATVQALTTFLDDPSPLVRRALADAFASATEAPHHIVAALAEDQPGIAAIVLSRSPLFSDAELIDVVTNGGESAQNAVASRFALSAPLAAVLAEVGMVAALVTLAGNFGAELSSSAIARMVARHGSHGSLRDALLARGGLPPTVRVELVAATAGALAALVTGRDWMSAERAKRVTREATERATIAIAAADGLHKQDLEALANGLRASGQLTIAFALRALLSGNRALFRAVLGALSGMAPERIEGLLRQSGSAGFAALYRKAGLPLPLLPVFRAVLEAPQTWTGALRQGTALSSPLVKVALTACGAGGGDLDKLAALLRRFEAEAERDAARAAATPFAPARTDAPLPILVPLEAPKVVSVVALDFDEAVPASRALPMAEPQPARFTIDLAAIEAELLAA